MSPCPASTHAVEYEGEEFVGDAVDLAGAAGDDVVEAGDHHGPVDGGGHRFDVDTAYRLVGGAGSKEFLDGSMEGAVNLLGDVLKPRDPPELCEQDAAGVGVVTDEAELRLHDGDQPVTGGLV